MQQLFVRACWNHHETWTVLEARLWNKIACNEQLCLRSSASVFLNRKLLAESFFQAQEQILLIQGSEKFLKPSGSDSSFISWFLANPPYFQASLSLGRDWSNQPSNYQGDNTWSIFKNLGLLTMQVKPPCILFPWLQRTESRNSPNVGFSPRSRKQATINIAIVLPDSEQFFSGFCHKRSTQNHSTHYFSGAFRYVIIKNREFFTHKPY